MCGIAGICDIQGAALPQASEAWVQAACDAMQQRGPNGWGLWREGAITLGHRRLSIIDLSSGGQPMQDVHKECCITFNGEIYNFAAVRRELEGLGARFATHSDTEVILEAWRAWGTACLDKFEGMFAFVLWDARTRTVFAARDRFGKKPLYYTVQGGRFAFASELTALCQMPELTFTVQPQAVMRYLAYEYVPTPQCIYQEVSKLPPAHFLLLRDGAITIERYWDLPVPQALGSVSQGGAAASEAELGSELRRLMTQAVQRRMVSDVPLGALLSGGIDSTITTALMAQLSSRPVETFSIGFTEASYDESRYARAAARFYGTHHHERIFDARDCAAMLPECIMNLDEPMADASIAPTTLVSALAREHVTVALGGDGADELWAGYEHYIGYAMAAKYNTLPRCLREKIIEPLCAYLPASAGYINVHNAAATFLQGAHAPDWLRVQSLLTALTPDMQRGILLHPNEHDLRDEQLFAPTRAAYEHWRCATPLQRAFHVYARTYMLDDILMKVDRASMRHSLEVRAPFLDRDVAEFVARLPVQYKLHGFTRKYLLKKACADLLPPEIKNRNKRGFQIPVAAWLRSELRPLVEELLGAAFLKQQGLFDPAGIQKLVNAHMSGAADLRKPLWTLLVLQLWWQKNKPALA